MEISFSKLKKLDVICLADGKNLGRICDVVFTMPDGKIKGFFATGCKGFKFSKQEVFIPLGDIAKIGEDAVLVKNCGEPPKKPCPPKHKDNCKPDCPPPPNPCGNQFNAPPNHCGNQFGSTSNPCGNQYNATPNPCGNQFNTPYDTQGGSRRNFDDYE